MCQSLLSDDFDDLVVQVATELDLHSISGRHPQHLRLHLSLCARVNGGVYGSGVPTMANDPVATARGSVTRSNTISAPKRPNAGRRCLLNFCSIVMNSCRC